MRVEIGLFRAVFLGLIVLMGLNVGPAFSMVKANFQQDQGQQHVTPTQSVTGKLVAISDKQLTLEVQGDTTSDPMDFVVDSSTKVDGNVQPGSTVSVDYRTQDNKRYATHVMLAAPANPPSTPK
jgi:hypothetical protein